MIKMCAKCGIELRPKEDKEKVFVECSICGYREEVLEWIEAECPSCEYNKALVLLHEMVRGDEGTTTMYKCLRCNAVWKDGYRGF